MQALEYSGVWWLPANPQNKITGTLSFSNEDGIALRLIGALQDFGSFKTGPQLYPLILGLSGDGKEVTLSNCVFTGVEIGMPGFARESYMGSLCLIGGHFNDPDEIRFAKFEVRYSHLPDWVRTSGFEVKRSWNEHKVQVSYSLPPDLEAVTSKGTISLSFACNTAGDGIEELNLRQSVWMEVTADKEYAFEKLSSQYIRPLQKPVEFSDNEAEYHTRTECLLEAGVLREGRWRTGRNTYSTVLPPEVL